ncbi:MAG: hypothetical protein MJ142_07850 [Clostridia bacterium]|nr:hypothetical protein [Clostridia bacterium]
MMKGYDKQEAMDYIVSGIKAKDHPELQDCIPQIISLAIDADMQFMHDTHVLDEDGGAGTEYYDDDDAFEFMVEYVAEKMKLDPVKAVKVASLIDDYMDLQQAYLESKGLVEWE